MKARLPVTPRSDVAQAFLPLLASSRHLSISTPAEDNLFLKSHRTRSPRPCSRYETNPPRHHEVVVVIKFCNGRSKHDRFIHHTSDCAIGTTQRWSASITAKRRRGAVTIHSRIRAVRQFRYNSKRPTTTARERIRLRIDSLPNHNVMPRSLRCCYALQRTGRTVPAPIQIRRV